MKDDGFVHCSNNTSLLLKVCMEGVGLLFHHSKVRPYALFVFVSFCQLIYVIYIISYQMMYQNSTSQSRCGKFWYYHEPFVQVRYLSVFMLDLGKVSIQVSEKLI